MRVRRFVALGLLAASAVGCAGPAVVGVGADASLEGRRLSFIREAGVSFGVWRDVSGAVLGCSFQEDGLVFDCALVQR